MSVKTSRLSRSVTLHRRLAKLPIGAVDELDDSVTLGEAMVIWNNKYIEAGGGIALTPRKKP